MHLKLLEIPLKKSFSKSTRDEICKKLHILRKEFLGKQITYRWNKKGNELQVKLPEVVWRAIFTEDRVEIFVDGPFYLIPSLRVISKKIIPQFIK